MKNIRRGAAAALGLAALLTVANADDATLETERQKFSYAWGYSIGQLLMREFAEQIETLDRDAVLAALRDVMSGSELAMSLPEMEAVLRARQEQARVEQAARADEALAMGRAFLEENRAREGVATTDSGLQYEILTPGAGERPTAEDTVVVHYRGTLLDGTEFDSSYRRGNPTTFPLAGVIEGWQEALQLMREDAKWKVYIPPELGYGARGSGGGIGPNETLVFEIELIEIK